MRVWVFVVALIAEVVSAGTTDHPRLCLFGSPGEPAAGVPGLEAIANQAHLALAAPQAPDRLTVPKLPRAVPASGGFDPRTSAVASPVVMREPAPGDDPPASERCPRGPPRAG